MFAICMLSIKNYWVNGFGVLPWKKMPFGKELLLPSMVLTGVAGAQNLWLVLKKFAFGNIFRGVGIGSLDLLALSLDWVQMFSFGMIDGAGVGTSKIRFHGCILLLRGRMLQ